MVTFFWKELLIRLTICSLFMGLFVVLVVSHLGFKGGNLVLITPVHVDCFPFTLYNYVFYIGLLHCNSYSIFRLDLKMIFNVITFR